MLNTKTENGDLAHSSTGNSRVDLFFQTVRSLDTPKLFALLEKSAQEDLEDTAKLIFHLRDVRGGKGERKLFRECLLWLAQYHPQVLHMNLHLVAEYGRWDDLLSLFYLHEMGAPVDVAADTQKEIQQQILTLIAKQLKEDLVNMEQNKKISLCAKWLPSERQHHDKRMKIQSDKSPLGHHSLTKSIAKALGVNKAQYRKTYLSPLRKYLKVIERNMSAKEWSEINYEAVPSQAMNKHKKAFKKNDADRFSEYEAKLSSGEAKVNASTLHANQLVSQYFNNSKEEDPIIEAQWDKLVEETAQLGSLDRAVVLSDVSGSMSGEPMQVSVALGILIATLSSGPFKNNILTFDSTPSWFQLTGKTLREKVTKVLRMPWGYSTNFVAAMRLILNRALEAKTPADKMPQTLYVISDMQFDQAESGNSYMSSHQLLKKEFEKHGYELPRIVYWNVRSSSSFPTDASSDAVALVSGFSQSALKAVINADVDAFTPYGIMRTAIDDERYKPVKVELSQKDESKIVDE